MSRDGEASITHLTDPVSFLQDELEITDGAYRHLFRSRRLENGVSIRVVNGEGAARIGKIQRVERKKAWVELGPPLPSLEPTLRLHLKVGALRPERADWLVEKTTELGIYSITFMATERTPRNYGDGRLERLGRVATAAVEQSRRSRRPTLDGVLPWSRVLEELDPSSSWVLHPDGEPFSKVLSPESQETPGFPADVTLLVGPEGGFSSAELAAAAERGVRRLCLGTTILRVETAAVVASGLFLTC